MASDSKMRMPYGPGWEDPDWSAHAAPPDESAAMKLVAQAEDERPVVGSLAQFMEIVKRFASPRRHRREAAASHAQPALQTRRWVMAGGAGFVALATLPGAPKVPDPSSRDTSRVAVDDTPVFDRMPPRRPRNRA